MAIGQQKKGSKLFFQVLLLNNKMPYFYDVGHFVLLQWHLLKVHFFPFVFFNNKVHNNKMIGMNAMNLKLLFAP
jgi:hypothetical protein